MTSNDALFDVPDATDWNNTLLSGFVAVESPMRCQVCKEFIKTPMITSCGHTFCSECIRRSLSHNGLCPACRSPDQELKLRPNKSMEEVVEAFQRTRAAALEVARAQPAEVRSPKRKRRDVGSRGGSLEPSKKTRTSGRISSRTTPQASMEGGLDLAAESDEDYTPDDGLVPCPVCGERMKEAAVNKHMDDIHFNPAPSRQPTSLTGFATHNPSSRQHSNKGPANSHPKPLPTISYNLLRDKALREKLQSLGIPAHGTRPLMERRHREWMTLWNANCDATHPKSKKELLRDLDVWERTQAHPAVQRGPKESQVGNKEFDGEQWATQHANEFDSLVEQARKHVAERRAKEAAAAEEAKKEAQEAPGNRESQRIEIASRSMSQNMVVEGTTSTLKEGAQPETVSATRSMDWTRADMNTGSNPKEQPQQENEMDIWWMKDMEEGGGAQPGNNQLQNQGFSGAQGAAHPYPQVQDRLWNGSHPTPQDDETPWSSEMFNFPEQSPQQRGDLNQNIDPALNGASGFDFDAYLQERPAEAKAYESPQQGSETHLQQMINAAYLPLSSQPPPSSQPQHQQQRHQQSPSQQPAPYQTVPLSFAASDPLHHSPPITNQQHGPPQQGHNRMQNRANPSNDGGFGDAGLQRMLQSGEVSWQNGEVRNRDGSQMTAQQRLEILKRPYRRTGEGA